MSERGHVPVWSVPRLEPLEPLDLLDTLPHGRDDDEPEELPDRPPPGWADPEGRW